MTSTTIQRSAPLSSVRSVPRFVFAVVFAVVLIAAAYAVGRATSPTHTIHSVITVPAAASAPADGPTDACRHGRAC
jgi:hypothetical protein